MQIFSQCDFGPMNLHKDSRRFRRMRHRNSSLGNWSGQNSNSPINDPGYSDRVESRMSCARLAGNLQDLRAFTRAQELRQRASEQEGDGRQNDHDLDERENFSNVFTARHSAHDSFTRLSDPTSRSAIGLRSYRKHASRLVGGDPHDSRSHYCVLIPGST